MTTLTIIPNYEKKRLKLVGTVAAGEHVAVTIVGGGEWAQSGTLRLRALFGGKTVAVFPYYTEQREVDGQTVEADSWSGDEDATCELNLNTISAEKMLRFGGECLWVLDDPANHTLYGTGEFFVGKWPKHRPFDIPYDLDSYPDAVRELSSNVESLSTQLQLLSQNKVDKVNGKSLTTNDYTNEDKQKLDGIEAGAQKNVGVEFTQAEKRKLGGIADGANNYTLPPATAQTLGGVKQGTGCEIAADGTLTVTGGGTADSVAWNDITDKPTTFPPSSHTHPQSEVDGLVVALTDKYEKPATGIPATDLAQAVQTALSAIPGKAPAADLRYRIAEAGYATTGIRLPEGATVWLNGVDVTRDGTFDIHDVDYRGFVVENAGLLVEWHLDGSSSRKVGGIDVVLKVDGTEVDSFDLLVPRALADRTVNLITADWETSIDIAFPDPQEGHSRDFYLAVTCGSTTPTLNAPTGVTLVNAKGGQPDLSLTPSAATVLRFTEVKEAGRSASAVFCVTGGANGGGDSAYPMVAVTPSNGTLTVTPYTVATSTAGDSAAAFTVAVGTGETGKARDCELVIDCTAVGAIAPTVTWPSNFHPRTDAEDFACEAGVRNVYYISEYATGQYVVGGWQETTGGNA